MAVDMICTTCWLEQPAARTCIGCHAALVQQDGAPMPGRDAERLNGQYMLLLAALALLFVVVLPLVTRPRTTSNWEYLSFLGVAAICMAGMGLGSPPEERFWLVTTNPTPANRFLWGGIVAVGVVATTIMYSLTAR